MILVKDGMWGCGRVVALPDLNDLTSMDCKALLMEVCYERKR